jgi:hypothetical protein
MADTYAGDATTRIVASGSDFASEAIERPSPLRLAVAHAHHFAPASSSSDADTESSCPDAKVAE